MAKGNTAKQQLTDKIVELLGDDFIAVIDKKILCWADDGGEKVQIAISMTCPKTAIGDVKVNSDDMDFGTKSVAGQVSSFKPAEITKEETDNVNKLLAELGF